MRLERERRGMPHPSRSTVGLTWGIPLLAACALLIGPQAARAFDGNFKGLVVGVGLGAGSASYYDEFDIPGALDGPRRSNVAFVTNYRLGIGLTDRVALMYDHRACWFGLNRFVIAAGVGSGGLMWYVKPGPRAWYVCGGAGLAAWDQIGSGGTSGMEGFGFYGGAGYEFTKRWCVEASVGSGRPKDGVHSIPTTLFQATAVHLWY